MVMRGQVKIRKQEDQVERLKSRGRRNSTEITREEVRDGKKCAKGFPQRNSASDGVEKKENNYKGEQGSMTMLRKMCVCVPGALALSSVRSGVRVGGSSRNTLSYGESRESRGGD